jgi:ABC-2 type transport system permease protein
MRSFLALIKREYLEHRGAFLYAPAVILVIIAGIAVIGFITGRTKYNRISEGVIKLQQIFDLGFAGSMWMWWCYLLIALFFFYADAFNADRRNNSLLFWKSMPQSDLKMLSSKMGAGLTVFPGLIFIAALITGVIVVTVIVVSAMVAGGQTLPEAGDIATHYVQVAAGGVLYYALGLIWFAPFFAWVGLLSTLVGRWSIPLAFLIPGLLILFEILFLDLSGPEFGYVASYLESRIQYGMDYQQAAILFFVNRSIDVVTFARAHLATIDWVQMGIGIVFVLLMLTTGAAVRKRALAGT